MHVCGRETGGKEKEKRQKRKEKERKKERKGEERGRKWPRSTFLGGKKLQQPTATAPFDRCRLSDRKTINLMMQTLPV
jgi:hypothetical protein